MGHDWIYEVLEDLRSYALKNGLVGTAARAEEALEVARAEIAAIEEHPGLAAPAPNSRAH